MVSVLKRPTALLLVESDKSPLTSEANLRKSFGSLNLPPLIVSAKADSIASSKFLCARSSLTSFSTSARSSLRRLAAAASYSLLFS